MRLTENQKVQIRNAVFEVVGSNAEIRLFGSRLDDNAKGGDIDLLVTLKEPIEQSAYMAAKIAAKIMIKLNEQKIDVIIEAPNLSKLPIHDVARQSGVMI